MTAGQSKCNGLAKGIWAAGLGSSAPLLPTWDLERERRHGRAVAPLSGNLHGKAAMQGEWGAGDSISKGRHGSIQQSRSPPAALRVGTASHGEKVARILQG